MQGRPLHGPARRARFSSVRYADHRTSGGAEMAPPGEDTTPRPAVASQYAGGTAEHTPRTRHTSMHACRDTEPTRPGQCKRRPAVN